MKSLQTFLATLALILMLALPVSTLAQRKKPKTTEIQGHTMYTLLEPGGIPAIFDPEFISIEQAETLYYDDEPLLAISVGDEAKAYSIWHLDHHEVVNDYIGGKAITVTW